MKRLILLRHGKSDYPDGVVDYDRPLAPRGRREAPLAAEWLNEHYPILDLIVHSGAARAQSTAYVVRDGYTQIPDMREDSRLYLADDDELMAVARELPAYLDSVLLVGHNPALEMLIATLAYTRYPMRTSSIAVLAGSGEWDAIAPGWATLEQTATPRPKN